MYMYIQMYVYMYIIHVHVRLPFPQACSDNDVANICRLHTLWALHFDPFVDAVSEIVSALLRSSCPELLGVLRRVCAQLADLSPALATLVAR